MVKPDAREASHLASVGPAWAASLAHRRALAIAAAPCLPNQAPEAVRLAGSFRGWLAATNQVGGRGPPDGRPRQAKRRSEQRAAALATPQMLGWHAPVGAPYCLWVSPDWQGKAAAPAAACFRP
jgi:hypothetical protein